ncbi:MAG: hypothetical protein MUF15_08035 [Acidobacteria bacterium]|nr:hypothetical protein [Acidobacteriota bacterium]
MHSNEQVKSKTGPEGASPSTSSLSQPTRPFTIPQSKGTTQQMAPIQKYCGHPECKDPDCKNPKNHPPTKEEIMESIDPIEALNRAMSTATARYAQQSQQEELPDHLKGNAIVNKKERREAEIKSPRDRILLSGENKGEDEDLHYVQLTQRPSPAEEPIVVGRLQDPTNKNAPLTERHIFERGTRGAPTYPKEAQNLSAIKTEHDMSDAEVFQQVGNALMVQPLDPNLSEKEMQHVITPANIIGISEQRREPGMGFLSAQTIDFASHPKAKKKPQDVFGKKDGKINRPGLLPASGTGATQNFKDFRAALEKGEKPTSPEAKKIYKNMKEQHKFQMGRGFSQKTMKRLHEEELPREQIHKAAVMHMQSAATRKAARMINQLPYDLRSLQETEEEPEHSGAASATTTTTTSTTASSTRKRPPSPSSSSSSSEDESPKSKKKATSKTKAAPPSRKKGKVEKKVDKKKRSSSSSSSSSSSGGEDSDSSSYSSGGEDSDSSSFSSEVTTRKRKHD